ncbi:hypothetical protein IAR55_000674 [Kwoniella newhampshirensis]|uniref:Uncharacterized protein n=1 Tax=Kwoniella newhampshirensis TaxID=1651941 RepID=A0AAW0Z8M0_9TREE
MVFQFPSLPSGKFSTFIDTSPPVFYPAPKPTPPRDRSRSKSTNVDSPGRPYLPSYQSSYSLSNAQYKADEPVPDCPSSRPRLGNLLHASISVSDVSERIWEPLPGGGLNQRRGSVGSASIASSSIGGGGGGGGGGGSWTPTKPSHRRSQSALPLPGRNHPSSAPAPVQPLFSRPSPSPMGRLQEFSRNALASTSAVSLPTLVESETDICTSAGGGHSVPASPIVRPLHRPVSQTARIIPPSPLLSPTSSSSPIAELEEGLQGVTVSGPVYSSVPPPQHQSMPPPSYLPPLPFALPSPSRAGGRSRPPASPRSWSVQDISAGVTRPPSLRHRRASIESNSSVSLSDVAVLATWSFPASPENRAPAGSETTSALGGGGDEERGRKPGPSERLKERLRNISGVETTSSLSSSLSISLGLAGSGGGSPISRGNASGTPPRSTMTRPSRPLPSHLSNLHRHTHSSPNLLQLPTPPKPVAGSITSMGPPAPPNPLLPPPKPQRRPTTTRLRQPNPLSMPVDHTQGHGHGFSISQSSTYSVGTSTIVGGGGGKELSSSPGSMVSDSSSLLCPSPTSSVKSLPIISSVHHPLDRSYSRDGGRSGVDDATSRGSLSRTDTEIDTEAPEERVWWRLPSFVGGGGGGGGSKERSRSDSIATTSTTMCDMVQPAVDSRDFRDFSMTGGTGRELKDGLSTLTSCAGSGEDDEDYIDLDNM